MPENGEQGIEPDQLGEGVRDWSDEEEVEASLATPLRKPYDPAPAREKKRGEIALALVAALLFLLLAAFLSLWFKWAEVAAVEGILEILLAPVVGLVGAVTGFYFGTKQS